MKTEPVELTVGDTISVFGRIFEITSLQGEIGGLPELTMTYQGLLEKL